jgi:hypothetical protein
VSLEVLDKLCHGLLGHLSTLGENADGCSGVVQVLKNRSVGRSHCIMSALGQSDDDQIIERNERLAQQRGQVEGSLARIGIHLDTVRNQSDADAVAFVVHAPGPVMEGFSRAVSDLAAQGNDNPGIEEVLSVAQQHGIEMLGPVPA